MRRITWKFAQPKPTFDNLGRKFRLQQLSLDRGVVRFSEGFRFLGVIFLKDLLLQPWKPGRKHLRVLSAAGPLPPAFFPESERRPLRRYRSF